MINPLSYYNETSCFHYYDDDGGDGDDDDDDGVYLQKNEITL